MDFEKALRGKYRYSSPQGELSTEDLFDTPLTSTRPDKTANLNDIAKGLSKKLKAEAEEDFVDPKPGASSELQDKLEIVKYVIHLRQAENDLARQAIEKKQQKDRILTLIARKQDEALEAQPLEELQKLVAGL